MKHTFKFRNRRDGFTLVEVIVTIMVAAILGIMFVQVMETSLTGSVEPLTRAQHMFEMNGAMEKITRDYNKLMEESAAPLEELRTYIDSLNALQQAEEEPAYSIEYNYIKFSDGIEEVGVSADGILKVTIADVNGEQGLTALFTK